jgi:acyl-CoA synthetase (AMP-forming)/AMP-acid ligase II
VSAVLDHCGDQLADFKVPQYVTVVVEPLPRTPSGKLRKDRLREHVEWGAPVR